MKNQAPKSTHVFIFPFSWKQENNLGEVYFNTPEQLEKIAAQPLAHWEKTTFNLNSDSDYNEYMYFYKPVRTALYSPDDTKPLAVHYTHRALSPISQLTLSVKDAVYTLPIKKINLKLYKTGVGLLQLTCHNTMYQDTLSLAAINSFHKCVYPPTLPLDKAKEKIFPDWIRVRLSASFCIEEKFDTSYKHLPVPISRFIMRLLGKPFRQMGARGKKGDIFIEPILGNKMFVLCLYESTPLLEQILASNSKKEHLQALLMGETESCLPLKMAYLEQPHYVYGMTQYSFIGVTQNKYNSRLYDQLVSLALVQRTSLLNFSATLSEISALPKERLVPAIQSLYSIYIQFINQLYFKEVTGDAEGSLIYEQLSKQMNNLEELNQLNFEMQEVHEFATLIDQSQSKHKMDLLTIVGAALVVPTFVTGFFGMNILEDRFYDWWRHKEIALWFNSYFLFPVLALVLLCFWQTKGTKRGKWVRTALMILLILSVLITFFFGCGLVKS